MDTTSKRQQEIIAAAGRLLIQKGVKGLTTKNLAEEMAFSESALYRHFKNKEDIIVLLLDYLANNITERLLPIVLNENTENKKLEQIFESQFQFFEQNPHFVVAILSEGLFNETEKINKSIEKIIQNKFYLIYQIMEEGKKKEIFLDWIPTEDMVHILMGSFRMMVLKWKFSKFQLDLKKEGNRIMQTNLKLLKA